jgi:hypothetical protein
MKRIVFPAVCAIAFFFIAAPIYMKHEARDLVNGGKPFAKAQFVNGQWAISMHDFSKMFSGSPTLEPNFQLQGNRLVALLPSNSSSVKHKVNDGALLPAVSKAQPGAIILQHGAPFVRKAGEVSHNVFMAEGQAWVPASDVARAFGGNLTTPAGNTLGLTVNGDGILGFAH